MVNLKLKFLFLVSVLHVSEFHTNTIKRQQLGAIFWTYNRRTKESEKKNQINLTYEFWRGETPNQKKKQYIFKDYI